MGREARRSAAARMCRWVSVECLSRMALTLFSPLTVLDGFLTTLDGLRRWRSSRFGCKPCCARAGADFGRPVGAGVVKKFRECSSRENRVVQNLTKYDMSGLRRWRPRWRGTNSWRTLCKREPGPPPRIRNGGDHHVLAAKVPPRRRLLEHLPDATDRLWFFDNLRERHR